MAYGDNLTPDVATGLGAWADIEIVRAMRNGVDHANMVLCPTMPRYDGSDGTVPAMTDLEADLIVDYLRSLPAVSRTIPVSVCPPIEPPVPPDSAAARRARRCQRPRRRRRRSRHHRPRQQRARR